MKGCLPIYNVRTECLSTYLLLYIYKYINLQLYNFAREVH